MGLPWASHGKSMGMSWEAHEKPWEAHGRPMGSPWEFVGSPLGNLGKPMGGPWEVNETIRVDYNDNF